MSHEPFPTSNPAVVTCGLPYANGDLHIGHLRTYVSGDVLARYLEKLGQDTAFVCGSDMHGTPIAVAAQQEGITPEEFARSWHETYEETFPKFDIDFDNYGNTHDETNTELTREFVRSWIDNDHVYEREIQVAWDPEADQPLPDRFVEGTCPYCGAKARGDECDEGCQRHLEPGEIEDPTSTLTGNPAEYRTRTHKFLRLQDFQAYLSGFLDRLEGTENARNQPREWIEGDLQDLCITRDMDWGIDYPGEGAENLVLYVWVDAPIEYVSSTRQYSERVGADTFDWEQAWGRGTREDVAPDADVPAHDGEIVHIIGRDIIQHHTVFWPAMLRGAGYGEPRAVMASGFVNLNGNAFSTSRNRAIWADEYLETEFEPDLLRYYLTTTGGFQQDVDFAWNKFQDRVNGELVGTVGNFIYRSLLFAHREFEGTPETSPSPAVTERIEGAIDAIETAINEYSLRNAGQAALSLAQFGNEYIQQHEPWHLIDEDPEEAATVIRDCVQLSKALAVLLEPITPRFSEQLYAQLGEPASVHEASMQAALEAPPGAFGGPPAELVDKIPDERVEALNASLEQRIESEDSADGVSSEPIDDERISFETFESMDLRVGEILEASPIEDADSLLRLKVDIGPEVRQVVAGLKGLHDVDSLPGTKVIVLANLEPATLMGVESNGMILAAGEEADLLTTLGDAPVGTRIH